MFEVGKTTSAFCENVMVKIPGPKAGVAVVEELTALGINTTPSVCLSVSLLVAMARAYERGCSRAKKAGLSGSRKYRRQHSLRRIMPVLKITQKFYKISSNNTPKTYKR